MTRPDPSAALSPPRAAGSAPAFDLVVLGELNPDVVLDTGKAYVPFDQVETEADGGALVLGSSGAITAAAARTMGLTVAMVAVIGDDQLGRLTTEMLADHGVDVSAVAVRPGLATGLTVVINAPGGDRALLTYPGAMAALRVADVPAELVGRAQHVHISSIFLQKALVDGLAGLLVELRGHGVTTSLDTGWDPDRDWTLVADLLAGLDYLLPNEAELRELSRALALGVDDHDPDWVARAATELSRRGPTVVVKRGGHGTLMCAADIVYELRTTPAVPFDTTGAGDNFDAGFLEAVVTGAGPARRLAQAVAAGTASLRGRGGTGSMVGPSQLSALADGLEGLVQQRRPSGAVVGADAGNEGDSS